MHKLDWFLRAKYGAIIHWGLYAIPGGIWQGEAAPHGGEWLMKNWRQGIPYAEYAKLADQFNPTAFDAEEYVRFLRDCGFQYLVFTAKHHDGFAMYDSKCCDYNIMHTPYEMNQDECQELVDYVRSFQPDCLINGRVGYNLGDYRQMGDRGIPLRAYVKPWEVPMTLNDTWGYRVDDDRWKTPERVIRLMAEIAGKGGNLLLNIGPDGDGNIPEESRKILRTVGDWLKENGDSIFGADPVPDFPYRLDEFGCFTYNQARRKLYMHIFNYPAVPPHQICVVGLKTKVGKARLLKTGEEILCWQTYETARDEHRLRVRLPYATAPDPLDTVIEIDVEDDHLETQML